MVYSRISSDLKMASIRLRRRGLDSVKDICDITGISVPTLYRSWALYARTGSFVKARLLGLGRPRKVYHRDAQYLLHLARYNPTTFLDEYRAMLDKNRHLSLHISTIHRVFLRAGLSVKRVQKMAKERDPVKRADYIRRIGAYSPVCLIFIDDGEGLLNWIIVGRVGWKIFEMAAFENAKIEETERCI